MGCAVWLGEVGEDEKAYPPWAVSGKRVVVAGSVGWMLWEAGVEWWNVLGVPPPRRPSWGENLGG